MQFIPSTWQVVKVDADGDGKRNPQDMDDAALATAVYLCSGKDNLSNRQGQEAAVYRYNHSQDYVNLVLRIMEAYSSGDYTAVPSGAYGGTSFSSSSYSSAIDQLLQGRQGPQGQAGQGRQAAPPRDRQRHRGLRRHRRPAAADRLRHRDPRHRQHGRHGRGTGSDPVKTVTAGQRRGRRRSVEPDRLHRRPRRRRRRARRRRPRDDPAASSLRPGGPAAGSAVCVPHRRMARTLMQRDDLGPGSSAVTETRRSPTGGSVIRRNPQSPGGPRLNGRPEPQERFDLRTARNRVGSAAERSRRRPAPSRSG